MNNTNYDYNDNAAKINYNTNPTLQQGEPIPIPRIAHAIGANDQVFFREEVRCIISSLYDRNMTSYGNGMLNNIMGNNDTLAKVTSAYMHCLAWCVNNNNALLQNTEGRRSLLTTVIALEAQSENYFNAHGNTPDTQQFRNWYSNYEAYIKNLNMVSMVTDNKNYMDQLDRNGQNGNNNNNNNGNYGNNNNNNNGNNNNNVRSFGSACGNNNNNNGNNNNNNNNNGMYGNNNNNNGMCGNNNNNGMYGNNNNNQGNGGLIPADQYSNNGQQGTAMYTSNRTSKGIVPFTEAQKAEYERMPANAATQAPQQIQTVQPTVQPTQQVVSDDPKEMYKQSYYPTVEEGIKRTSDGVVRVNPAHPEYETVKAAGYAVKGGWKLNPQVSKYGDDDIEVLTNYRWFTKYGIVDNATKLVCTAASSMGGVRNSFETNLQDLKIRIGAEYPEYDDITACPEFARSLNTMVLDQRRAYRDLYFGALLGDFPVTVDTYPWSYRNTSATELFVTLFSKDLRDLIGSDNTHIVQLHNRQYWMVDSSDPYINEIVVGIRNKMASSKWVDVDNVSSKGHYYLINPYAVPTDEEYNCIEDFYNMDQMMNPNKYSVIPATKSMIMVNEQGQEESIGGNEPARLKMVDVNKQYNEYTAIEAAEAMRDDCSINRLVDWENSVLHGGTTMNNDYLVITRPEDTKFWNKLQGDMRNGSLLSTVALGDFISGAVISPRMTAWLDGKLTKAYNTLFNNVLSFNGTLMIDNSFIAEYTELEDIINTDTTPEMIRALYHTATRSIITNLLSETVMTKPDIENFKAHTSLTIVDNNVKLGKELVPINAAVRNIRTKSSVTTLPYSISALGLNPYGEVSSIGWHTLPVEVYNLLRKHFSYNNLAKMKDVVLVTSDNYALKVSGCSDEIYGGTLSILK